MFARNLSARIASKFTAKPSKITYVPTMKFSAPAKAQESTEEIVIPELVNSLEWVIDSPPPIHQFHEPPIIVEIDHLENLIHHDH